MIPLAAHRHDVFAKPMGCQEADHAPDSLAPIPAADRIYGDLR